MVDSFLEFADGCREQNHSVSQEAGDGVRHTRQLLPLTDAYRARWKEYEGKNNVGASGTARVRT